MNPSEGGEITWNIILDVIELVEADVLGVGGSALV
jgi:hypothetical protein